MKRKVIALGLTGLVGLGAFASSKVFAYNDNKESQREPTIVECYIDDNTDNQEPLISECR